MRGASGSRGPGRKGDDRTVPARVLGLMRRNGIRPRKRFGQNFLVNEAVLGSILKSAELSSDDIVMEIGPGLGVLTAELAARCQLVVAIEIDEELFAILGNEIGKLDNVVLLNGDILEVDIQHLLREQGVLEQKAKVVANLPYNITTPVLMKLIESKDLLSRVVVMVQREVAERIAAGPGSKAYGSLSVFVQHYADVDLVKVVPPECFIPAPKVHSAILRIDFLDEPRFDVDSDTLFEVVGSAFGMRRKILKNALKSLPGIDGQSIEMLLARSGIDPGCRAEELAPEDFAVIAREYSKLRAHQSTD